MSNAQNRQAMPVQQIKSVLQRGIALQQARNFQAAAQCYQSVLRDHPKHPDALNLMGTISIEANRPNDAVKYFRSALKIRPQQPVFLYNLANAQMLDLKPQLAAETIRKLLAQNPKVARVWGTLARAEIALGNDSAALEAFDKAMALTPDDHVLAVERADILVALGRMDEASEVYRAAIAAGVKTPRALIGLSYARKFTADDPEPELMLEVLETEKMAPQDHRALRYAAGKAFADRKEYDLAFAQFETAKSNEKQKFVFEQYLVAQEKMKALFTQDFIKEKQAMGDPSARPIFIIGMPRSGTSLTEQILASHPRISGAGELPDMRKLARSIGYGEGEPDKFLNGLKNLTSKQIRGLAAQYLETLKKHSRDAAQVVDKMPHNFELLGMIAILFPNATIIHSKRDAMDICVSCYTRNFTLSHGYNRDLDELGRYYCAYDDLMTHWHEVMPGWIHDSQYEDLINDQEAGSRNLIAWTGQEWDDACLSFQDTDRMVKTPSRWQVRQPIYKTSMKAWKNYDKHLGPLKKALGRHAVD